MGNKIKQSKTNRLKSGLVLLLAGFLLSLAACRKDNDVAPSPEVNRQTLVGKKLENPYSVETMRKAYANLKKASASGRVQTGELDIQTTHLYLKFNPASESELSLLKKDSTLDWYGYPLDHEITPGNTPYRDPSIPEGTPTPQYTAVPVGKPLPQGVAYELLAELFIPDEQKAQNTTASPNGRVASEDFIDALVEEALRITGNASTSNAGNAKSGKVARGDWTPAGRMRVWDDVTETFRAIEGLQVKARRWFTTHSGFTDANGNYTCDGTFRREANYSIDWERFEFALREGWLDGANLNGPKQEGNWDLDFGAGFTFGKDMFHARVFMAAYHYYYKDIKGLRRPPENGVLKTQLRIRCYDEANADANGTHSEERRFLALGSQIKIYNPQNNMREIYSTTIHELAHASHWNIWRNDEDYDKSERIVKESWATGVDWELTRMVWPNYRGATTQRPNYTQVVMDMIDNPSDVNEGSENLTLDNVEGYTIRQIEDALQGQKSWNDWRNEIKNRYDNGTENNLDALFAHWD